MLLHFHLPGTYQELQQLDAALEHYKITLVMINNETPFGYAAKAHWGLTLLPLAHASQAPHTTCHTAMCQEMQLKSALEHAENARFLYYSMGELCVLQLFVVRCAI